MKKATTWVQADFWIAVAVELLGVTENLPSSALLGVPMIDARKRKVFSVKKQTIC